MNPSIQKSSLNADTLSELRQQVSPVALRSECMVAVPESLRALFPVGGLAPGSSIGVAGDCGWSLAFSLAAAALGSDGWMAVVGIEELGLVAANEYKVPLDRVVLVETPPVLQWSSVVAWLIESVDLVFVNPNQMVRAIEARRLSARAREQGALLFHLDGGRCWPQALDVSLNAATHAWEGIGNGHGRLQRRLVSVTASGRRSMAGLRQTHLWLPGTNGSVEIAESPKEFLTSDLTVLAGER